LIRQSYICCKELLIQWDYWQLVTAIQDEGHGLTLCKRHPHGDDYYLSLSVCFGLTGINIMDTFNMYLWIFLCNLIHTYYSSAFAGDVHCGGHSDILRNHKILFRQLTTSAIANMPLPKSAYYFMRAAGKLGRLQKDFCFRHHHWTRARNYGVVQIKHCSREDHQDEAVSHRDVEISAQLVMGRFMRGVSYGEKIFNTEANPCRWYTCYLM
jgi:hypothetical protein